MRLFYPWIFGMLLIAIGGVSGGDTAGDSRRGSAYDIKAIIRCLAARENRIESLTARYVVAEVTSGRPDSARITGRFTLLFAIDPGTAVRMRLEKEQIDPLSDKRSRYTGIWDGKVFRWLEHDLRQAVTDRFPVPILYEFLPLPYLYNFHGVEYQWSECLRTASTVDTEDSGGRLLIRFEHCNYRFVWSVDPRTCRIFRQEIRIKEAAGYEAFVYSDFKRIAEGVDLPMTIRRLVFSVSDHDRPFERSQPVGEQVLTVEEWTVNADLPSGAFDTSAVPEGYQILHIDRRTPSSAPSTGPATQPAKICVGDVTPELEVASLEGKPIKLDAYRGKYVLLDFWATWCAPCLKDIPHLKAVHKAYRNDDRLVMISLSFDRTGELPAKYAREYGLGWVQGLLAGSHHTQAALGYCGGQIPFVCLIDPDGRVIAADLRGEQIKEGVVEVLGPARSGRDAPP